MREQAETNERQSVVIEELSKTIEELSLTNQQQSMNNNRQSQIIQRLLEETRVSQNCPSMNKILDMTKVVIYNFQLFLPKAMMEQLDARMNWSPQE